MGDVLETARKGAVTLFGPVLTKSGLFHQATEADAARGR
jgi:hypothetical protein